MHPASPPGASSSATPAATPAAPSTADRLIAHAKAASTSHGYTSWPAYADRLERLVIALAADHSAQGARP